MDDIITDKTVAPDLTQLCEYVGNSLFNELCDYMKSEYNASFKIEYSGDKVLLGWNLKFKKAGRTLCTVYPRKGHFPLLLIVGRKEKDRVNSLFYEFSEEFRNIYDSTQEGMGQRWMIFDFTERNELFSDVLKVVRLRRESK